MFSSKPIGLIIVYFKIFVELSLLTKVDGTKWITKPVTNNYNLNR